MNEKEYRRRVADSITRREPARRERPPIIRYRRPRTRHCFSCHRIISEENFGPDLEICSNCNNPQLLTKRRLAHVDRYREHLRLKGEWRRACRKTPVSLYEFTAAKASIAREMSVSARDVPDDMAVCAAMLKLLKREIATIRCNTKGGRRLNKRSAPTPPSP